MVHFLIKKIISIEDNSMVKLFLLPMWSHCEELKSIGQCRVTYLKKKEKKSY